MQSSGNIDKMIASLGETVDYLLPLNDQMVKMNQLIGSKIKIEYLNQINCTVCGRVTKKSFAQGFCYPCFINSPENSECIIRPELCKGHLGEGRSPEWELSHHVQPHFVYLAASSDIKVGVTRATQVPTRWMDQGASKALVLAQTPNRFLAGVLEVYLKSFLTDKTDWRKMLKGEQTNKSLLEVKEQMFEKLNEDQRQYFVAENKITEINYPVLSWPEKVNSINLEKVPIVEGKLNGIKGQYLIFDNGNVMNLRSHTGYKINLEA